MRYFQAFENGSISEVVCGQRVDAIGGCLVELQAKRDDLTALSDEPPPEPSSDETLAQFRGQVGNT